MKIHADCFKLKCTELTCMVLYHLLKNGNFSGVVVLVVLSSLLKNKVSPSGSPNGIKSSTLRP